MTAPGWRRDLFALPDLVYLDGNSLGALPRTVADRVAAVVEDEWGRGLIGSWNHVPGSSSGWIDLVDRCARLLAPLLGVDAADVHVGESTSQSLFATTVAGARMRPDRRVLVVDRSTFPTDAYVVSSVARLLDLEVRWCEGPGDDGGVAALEAVLDDDVALVSLTHVDFRTGAMFDLPAVAAAIHQHGALAQWDLCHSTGAMPVDLAAAGADLAVGCTYKYLNAGPGSPAYAWVAPHLQADLDPPVAGWMGHASPFAMRLDHEPRTGVGRLRVGTPPVLALSALEAALGVFSGVTTAELRAASLQLTGRFLAHVDTLAARFPDEQVALVTPRAHHRRGSQVSFRHPHAYGLVQALIARGVVGDFRDPDIARFGFAPLYTTLDDVDRAAAALAEVLESRAYADPAYAERNAVT
ncbi:kynureninase [Nocardioides massiliensis]|uniref:Kynureninase n=3 Tax=Nocardioides massiliensis TaxID=1325935 RepID=A0ABT9NPF5_9ACTN|nr:aminotransferase class V-fold PLP-dependent enzyme [Nocardioides massiliensis]MDP9822181.1 kynureninase [Nocardioides massiliensis]